MTETKRHLHIAVDGRGQGTVQMNGRDISDVVTSVTIHARVGETPRAQIETLALLLEADLPAAAVHLADREHAGLIALGWTPPPTESDAPPPTP